MKDFSLKTERLNLRLFNKNDVDHLLWLYSDKPTMKFFNNIPDLEGIKKWITWASNHFDKNKFTFWAVEENVKKKFIGRVGIFLSTVQYDNQEKNIPVMSWIIHHNHWNQGYGTEASLACLEYAFNKLDIKTMYTTVDPKNTRSTRLIEKLGLIYQRDVLERGVISPLYAKDNPNLN